MLKEERLCLLAHAMPVFLSAGQGAQLILNVARQCCEYIILTHEGNLIYVQLGSREWDCETYGNRPLSLRAIRRLEQMKFARGGYRWNYWVTGEPEDPNGMTFVLRTRAAHRLRAAARLRVERLLR